MFGYVLPQLDRLPETARARYRAAYCGLCHSLQRNYGFRARFLVNYDMTFLYFLLRTGEPAQASRCFCPARPWCKKSCLPEEPAMAYAADLSVLLSYWKLLDVRRDGNLPRKAGAALLLRWYRRAYRRAVRRRPEIDRTFGLQLARLQRLEEDKSASLDRTADAFALLLRACADDLTAEEERRTAGLLLYHVGRYLYLVDALEDLPKDNRNGAYNPLRYRYALDNGALAAADRAQLLDTIDASVSMAASALELLENRDREILNNIIYYGLPAVLHSVAEGTFRRAKNRRKK